MSAPFNTYLIEQQLTESVDALQFVGDAADYSAVTKLGSFRNCSAYVILVSEKNITKNDTPQRRPSGRQQAMVTIGVILAARNYRDQTGSAAKDDMAPLIQGVRDALIGWTPGVSICRELEWQQGEVLDYDANTLLWTEVYTTTCFIGGNK